jgi:hypothetical protein
MSQQGKTPNNIQKQLKNSKKRTVTGGLIYSSIDNSSLYFKEDVS